MFKDDIKFCKQIYNKIYYVGESGRFYYESWEELKTDGFLSLYRGLNSALFGTVISCGIYFWWYRFLKNKFS